MCIRDSLLGLLLGDLLGLLFGDLLGVLFGEVLGLLLGDLFGPQKLSEKESQKTSFERAFGTRFWSPKTISKKEGV